jgi:subtilisin family serine protease
VTLRTARPVVALVCVLLLAIPAAASAQSAAPGPVVAVVDTGVDLTHPALRAHLWRNPGEIPANGIDDDHDGFVDDVNGADVVDGDGDPSDGQGHGTHIAGIVALQPSRSVRTRHGRRRWLRPRATGARIMAIRALGDDGRGDGAELARGIDYAIAHGARVLNLSLAYYGPDAAIRAALERAQAAGMTIVTASGNDGADLDAQPTYPAAFRLPGMIVVASATGRRLAATSGYGADVVDLAAPGVSIRSTVPGGRWGRMTGTSQATAAVSRAAVALLRARPGLSGLQVRAALTTTVRPAPATLGETITGGLLDLTAALHLLLG